MSKEFKQPITEREQQKAHDVIQKVKKALAGVAIITLAGFAVCGILKPREPKADTVIDTEIVTEVETPDIPDVTPDNNIQKGSQEQEPEIHYDDENVKFGNSIGGYIQSIDEDLEKGQASITFVTDQGKEIHSIMALNNGNGRAESIKHWEGKHTIIDVTAQKGEMVVAPENEVKDAYSQFLKTEAANYRKAAKDGKMNLSENAMNELDSIEQNGADSEFVKMMALDVSTILSTRADMICRANGGYLDITFTEIAKEIKDAQVKDYQGGVLEGVENLTDKAEKEAEEANKTVTDEETVKKEEENKEESKNKKIEEKKEQNKEDKKTEEENKKQVEEDTGKKNDDTEVVKPTKPAPPGPSDTKTDKEESKGEETKKDEETKAPEKPSEEKSSQVAEEGETSEEKKQNIEESLDFDDFFNDADAAAPEVEQESAENTVDPATVEDVADDFAE